MKHKRLYKVTFYNEGKVYEIYAREISQGQMYGFIEAGDFVFGEKSAVVVDPSEEKLKAEFGNVKRTFIPLHAVIRIDEVEKEGSAKITVVGDKAGNVAAFPGAVYAPGRLPEKPKE
jgi:hypothetical protein